LVDEFPRWSRTSARFTEHYDRRGLQFIGILDEKCLPNTDEMEALRKAVADHGTRIFETDEEQEGFRSQLVLRRNTLTPDIGDLNALLPLRKVHDGVLAVLPKANKDSDFVVSLLHSPEGSKDIQLPHRDLDDLYDRHGNLVRAVDPKQAFLLLVALEDNTSLLVYLGSHRENNQTKIPRRIGLNRGDVIRFHPRLVHAGDHYATANTRMHYYIMPKGFQLFDETHFPEPSEAKLLGDLNTRTSIAERQEKRKETKAQQAESQEKTYASRVITAGQGREAQAKRRLASSTDVPSYESPGVEKPVVDETPVAAEVELPISVAKTPVFTEVPVDVAVVADEDDIGVTYVEEGPGWGFNEKWWMFRRNYHTRSKSKKIRLEY